MEIVAYNRVRKYGGSYVIAIPSRLRKMLNLRPGDYMMVHAVGNNKLVCEKVSPDFDERKLK